MPPSAHGRCQDRPPCPPLRAGLSGPSASPSAPSTPTPRRSNSSAFEALEQLSALLHERGRGLADATTADIQDHIIDILERRRPSTANNRFRALHRFYAWLEGEEEIPNPMRRLKPPPVPRSRSRPRRRRAPASLRSLQGRGFDERRDTAILYLFLDAGPRLEELTEIRVQDIDFDVIHVVGKGGRIRALPFGNKTAQASTATSEPAPAAPMRTPRRSDSASGGLTRSGVSQIIRRRGEEAGIKGLHPTGSATPSPTAGADGGNETDLMRFAGWHSPRRRHIARRTPAAGSSGLPGLHELFIGREHSPANAFRSENNRPDDDEEAERSGVPELDHGQIPTSHTAGAQERRPATMMAPEG